MRKYRPQEVISLLTNSNSTFALSIFFFLAGISAGVFLVLIMDPSEKGTVSSYLMQYFTAADTFEYPNPFFSSMSSNLLLLIIITLAGLSIFGFPIALLAIMYKGMALGFSASLLIDSMALKGAFTVLITMVPQNMIIIPAFIVAVTAAENYGLLKIKTIGGGSRSSVRNNTSKKNTTNMLSSFLFLNLLLTATITVGCIIEALLFPIVV